MCLKKKSKKKHNRPPRQPRQGQYKKVNAYTLKPCIEQIITFIAVVTMIVLHSVFNVGAICLIDHEILYIMLVLHYLMLLILIILYLRITVIDPVDGLILDRNKNTLISVYIIDKRRCQSNFFGDDHQQYKYCDLCKSNVHFKSYHCNRCNRCTENFDHHCLYLNSCIGGKNYELFISIVMIFLLFMLNLIGQNVWLFVAASSNDYFGLTTENFRAYVKNEWVLIGIIVFIVCFLIPTLALCVFHFYMSCCLDITTLEFIQSQTEPISKSNSGSQNLMQTEWKPCCSKIILKQNKADELQKAEPGDQSRQDGSATNLV